MNRLREWLQEYENGLDSGLTFAQVPDDPDAIAVSGLPDGSEPFVITFRTDELQPRNRLQTVAGDAPNSYIGRISAHIDRGRGQLSAVRALYRAIAEQTGTPPSDAPFGTMLPGTEQVIALRMRLIDDAKRA